MASKGDSLGTKVSNGMNWRAWMHTVDTQSHRYACELQSACEGAHASGALLLTIAPTTIAHGRRCLPWASNRRAASLSPSAAHGPRSCVLFGLASHTNITPWGCHAQSGCEGSPNRRGGAGATARANSSAYAGAGVDQPAGRARRAASAAAAAYQANFCSCSKLTPRLFFPGSPLDRPPVEGAPSTPRRRRGLLNAPALRSLVPHGPG